MKILMVQNCGFINGQGGTEKICSFLSNSFAEQEHTLVIATNENKSGKNVYPLDSTIKIINVHNEINQIVNLRKYFNYKGKNPALWVYYKLKKKYFKLLNTTKIIKFGSEENIYKHNLSEKSKMWESFFEKNKFDLIITMSIGSLLEITNNNKIITPIINSTNGRPDYDYVDNLWFRYNIEKQLLKESYKYLSGIQILFQSYREFLPETFNGKIKVIANPVNQCSKEEIVKHNNQKSKLKIIHIGSLVTDCKQQNLAIDVFSKLADKHKNWELHFWGEGNDYNYLMLKISDLKLEKRVFLNGFTSSPFEKLKEADIFFFPSKYEGFPLALTEAMSVGLPSIGLSSCSGVNELITHNKTGFLCDDNEDLCDKLNKLMNDSDLRNKFGLEAHMQTTQYHPNAITENWNAFIKEVTTK